MGTLRYMETAEHSLGEILHTIHKEGGGPHVMPQHWNTATAVFERISARTKPQDLWSDIAKHFDALKQASPEDPRDMDQAHQSFIRLYQTAVTVQSVRALLTHCVRMDPSHVCEKNPLLLFRGPYEAKDIVRVQDMGNHTANALRKRGVQSRDWSEREYRQLFRHCQEFFSVIRYARDRDEQAMGFYACRKIGYGTDTVTDTTAVVGDRSVRIPKWGMNELQLKRVGIVGNLGNIVSREDMAISVCTGLVRDAINERCGLVLGIEEAAKLKRQA